MLKTLNDLLHSTQFNSKLMCAISIVPCGIIIIIIARLKTCYLGHVAPPRSHLHDLEIVVPEDLQIHAKINLALVPIPHGRRLAILFKCLIVMTQMVSNGFCGIYKLNL